MANQYANGRNFNLIEEQAGKRIQKIREKMQLSKAQFGKRIGVTGQHIGMIERGKQGLSINLIVKICNALETTADYILFGAVDPVRDPATVEALNGLTHEQIQIALDIIKKVAQFVNTNDGNEALIREVYSQQAYLKENQTKGEPTV
jgi:transcriptional regulator with XRE-family HTH domain